MTRPKLWPTTFFTQGDSWCAFNMHPGFTVGNINVTVDPDFLAIWQIVTGRVAVTSMTNAPQGMVGGFDLSHGGFFVDTTHQPNGIYGYTTQGVLYDRGALKMDLTPHHFRFHGQGGSTAGANTSNAPPWSDGVPTSGLVPDPSYWTRASMDNVSPDPLYIGHQSPPTLRSSTFWTVGGGNALISNPNWYLDAWDQANIDAIVAVEANGLIEALEYEFALAEAGGVVHEAYLIGYEHFPYDDLRYPAPADYANRLVQYGDLTPGGFHYGGSGVHANTVDPYYSYFTLPTMSFPPVNQAVPGFFKVAAAAGGLTRQWQQDGLAEFKPWYAKQFADNNFANYKNVFNFNPDPVVWDSNGWNAAFNTINSDNWWIPAGLEFSLALAAAYGVRNITSDNFNRALVEVNDRIHATAAAALNAQGRTVHVVPMWGILPYVDGTGPNYPCSDTSWFVDGVHMHEDGCRIWNDALWDFVLANSIHRRRVIEITTRRSDHDKFRRRSQTHCSTRRSERHKSRPRSVPIAPTRRSKRRLSVKRSPTRFVVFA